MNCPACGNQLQATPVEEITVDVCKRGCGGIWFDNFELQKMDERHETAGESLLNVEKNPNVSVDYTQRRSCPKCEIHVMMRHFMSVKREVEVDECPACGGFWLDHGELGCIRDQFETEADRQHAAAEYFSEVFGDDLAKMREESNEKLQKSCRIASMFRFLCPTYYIPGRQEWGAF